MREPIQVHSDLVDDTFWLIQEVSQASICQGAVYYTEEEMKWLKMAKDSEMLRMVHRIKTIFPGTSIVPC